MKKATKIILTLVLLCISLFFPACSQQYRVSEEEYEAAFTAENLSNVSISIEGPYWERYHAKEFYCYVDGSFVYCRYQEDVLYYGEFYENKDGKEAYYIYGSENFQSFTQENAVWRESFIMKDKNSFMHNTEFVRLYRRDFHLLEYNRKAKCYQFDFLAQGNKMTYSYFFENKKLTKFEITVKEKDYNLVWNFYNYGQTEIPEWAGKN
ncbi:MAG: hypothetical protein J6K86_06280 [Clostridia bacterium]|nr:hypothetical protein [Clostridia bacterium]